MYKSFATFFFPFYLKTKKLYSHHAVHYIPRTYLTYNWNSYLLTTFTHFTAAFPASGNHQSVVLSIYEFVSCFFVFFFYSPRISENIQYLYFTVWLFSFSIMSSSCCKWQDFLFNDWIIFLCACVWLFSFFLFFEVVKEQFVRRKSTLHLLIHQ